MKISLEELKARSKRALELPELIKIARETKSPNASFEIATNKTHITKEEAQACRYLAIIKRDYGRKTFEEFVDGRDKKNNLSLMSLLAYRQTVERFSFLQQLYSIDQYTEPGVFIEIPESDRMYFKIASQILKKFDEMPEDQKIRIFHFSENPKNLGRGSVETRGTIESINKKPSKPIEIDRYCLEKMTYFLFQVVSFLCKRASTPRLFIQLSVIRSFGA